MKNEKKKKRKLVSTLAIILYLAVCGCLGFFGAKYTDTALAGESKTVKMLFIVMIIVYLFVSFFLHIIIHEGGHLIFGLLSGYEFASFRIGSIMFVKKSDGLKVKRFSLAGTGGQCLMYIKDYNDGNFPYKLYNLGGALNNVIFSALAVVIYVFTKSNRFLAAFLLTFALIGVIVAVTNAVPISGQVDNDGKNAINLGKNKEAKRCFYDMMKINALLTQEVRLKDMSADLFVMPDKQYLSNGLCASMGALSVNRSMDKMDFQSVMDIGNYTLQNAEGLLGVHNNYIKLELAYCELINGRKEEAAELLDKEVKKFISVSKKNLSVIRTQYAYSLIHDNDEKQAENYLKNFDKYAESYPHKCEVESERQLLDYAKRRYDSLISNIGE